MALNLFDAEKHHVGLGSLETRSYEEIILAHPCIAHYWPATESGGELVDRKSNADLVPEFDSYAGTIYPQYGVAGPFSDHFARTAVKNFGVGGAVGTNSRFTTTIDSGIFVGTQGWTVEGWYKLDSYDPSSPPYFWQVDDHSTGGSAAEMYLFGNTKLTVQCGGGYVSETADFPLGTWQHIVARYNGLDGSGYMDLFRNGVLVASGPVATENYGPYFVWLNCPAGIYERPLRTSAAQLAIYNCPLPDIEIVERYTPPSRLWGFTLENAYAKFMQKEVPPGGRDVGGTLDLIEPKPEESHWVQDEFTGGTFQYRYDTDAAMFADCTGYVPAQQSKSLVTVPPVFFKRDFNPAAYGNPAGRTNLLNPSAMFTVAGSIFLCFEHGIMRYITGTDTFVWGNLDIDSNRYYVGAEYDRNEQCIYVLVGRLAAGSKPYLLRLDPETLTAWGSANQRFDNAPAKVQNSPPWGFQINDQNLVIGIGWRLYTVDPPVKPSDAADLPVWTHIGRLPGRWVDSVAYNGMTYILTATADGKTFIVAFDGTYILPIAGMAFNFQGTCMTVYGGRVYIGGSGTDINGTNRYAELHELTGSSTRLVRTFAPESRQSRVTYPREIWDLTVAEGLLWWSETDVRLWTYDLTGDAFFGSSVIQHPGITFYRQVVGRERLWLWGAHDTIPGQHGLYRIPIDGDDVAGYEGLLVTSDFMNDFAQDKKWNEIVILTRYYPATQVDYSLDGGATWTAIAGGVASGTGDLRFLTVDLSDVPESKVIRFRLHQPMGTEVGVFGELIAFTVSFTVQEPDKPLKHGWNIIINGAENVEARDGANQPQDVDLMKETLWGWAETKAKLTYKDVGGKNYTVKMQDFVEQQPIIGPNVTNGENPEAYFAVTLMETTLDED